jgi:hypothetical protein
MDRGNARPPRAASTRRQNSLRTAYKVYAPASRYAWKAWRPEDQRVREINNRLSRAFAPLIGFRPLGHDANGVLIDLDTGQPEEESPSGSDR